MASPRGSPSGAGSSPHSPQNAAVTQITEEVALARLDEAATQLQKEGRYMEALECMERGLVLRQRMYGVQSDEVRAHKNPSLSPIRF